MNHWIFIANNDDNPHYTAQDAYRVRMKHALWGIGANTPNRRNLRCGDMIAFYITKPARFFAGTASISSTILDELEQNKLNTERVFRGAETGVRLTEIEEWGRGQRY